VVAHHPTLGGPIDGDERLRRDRQRVRTEELSVEPERTEPPDHAGLSDERDVVAAAPCQLGERDQRFGVTPAAHERRHDPHADMLAARRALGPV
jgi:hypothetical protein